MQQLVALLKISLIVSILALGAVAQDLGSSNKLFGAGNKAESKPEKKAPSRSKKTASKTRSTAKKPVSSRTANSASASKKKAAAKPSNETAKKATPQVDREKYASFSDAKPATSKIKKDGTESARETLPAGGGASDQLFESAIEEGNTARDDRNYAIAAAAYIRAGGIKPKDSRADYGLGNIYSDQQRWEEAESAYRKSLQKKPDSAITNIALSYVLSQPLDVANLSDRYDEAVTLARKAIDLAPSNALGYDQLGVARELQGLITDETESYFRTSIKLDSSFAPAYAHLARFLRKRGRVKEADAAMKEAIKRADDAATMVLIAEVMQSEQQFVGSEALLNTALKKDPKNQAGLLLLARALTVQGKFSDAEAALLRSLHISPGSFAAYCQLGSLYSRQGKFSTAETALSEAQKSATPIEKRSLSRALEYLGDGYLRSDRSRDAERVYRQAMSLDRENESLAAKLDRAKQGSPRAKYIDN